MNLLSIYTWSTRAIFMENMATFTIQIQDTIKELDRAAEIIRAIRAGHPQTTTGDTGGVATTSVARWFNRLGAGSKIFWQRAARHAQSHREWTFNDLAESPEDKRALRSYHRNSYRAIKVEGAADPLVSKWDSKRDCQVYQIPDTVRDELLRLLEIEQRQDESQV
jgi:hypothetical protein